MHCAGRALILFQRIEGSCSDKVCSSYTVSPVKYAKLSTSNQIIIKENVLWKFMQQRNYSVSLFIVEYCIRYWTYSFHTSVATILTNQQIFEHERGMGSVPALFSFSCIWSSKERFLFSLILPYSVLNTHFRHEMFVPIEILQS